MERNQKQDLRAVMVQTFVRSVEEGVNLLVVLSDSSSTSAIGPFQSRFPERIVNVGIAEQNMVGVAAGLALGGYVVATANACPFLVARSNEQVKNDVCYSNTNVKLVGLNAGVTYGPLASTHHAIDDLAIMRGFGNILILCPSDPVEAAEVFRFALAHVGPVYIRMDNAPFPVLHEPEWRFQPGKIDILMDGSDVSIFAVGSLVSEALYAGQELARRGIRARVINVCSIRPADREEILRCLRTTGHAVTVEEHSVHGGLGSLVSEIAAEEGVGARVLRLGIPEGEFSIAGPRKAIRANYALDSEGIVKKTISFLGNRL